MSDFLPQPSPDDAPQAAEVPAQNVPMPPKVSIPESNAEVPESETEAEFFVDPVAQAADREGFRFIAIGFALFVIVIVVCAGIVALVMKNMGI